MAPNGFVAVRVLHINYLPKRRQDCQSFH